MVDGRVQNADDDERASGPVPTDGGAIPHEELPVSFRYGAGDIVGAKYRLVRLLGQGGMGDVWVAHNDTLDIDIAIKLLRSGGASGIEEDRFLREARAAARLEHPAIVRVFDFGTTDFGEPFMAMELLEGEDLATGLSRYGRLSATKAVRTLLPIAHALETAHSKGIVHRDLKPENVFLARTDDDRVQPKIVDFGIATIDRGENLRVTQKGTVVGSPGYMAPEQARGEDADHRADIWSFCVVLYETLTGTQPFFGKNDNALLYSIIAHEPAPITALAAGDDALASLIAKGLAKNPDKRWTSMRDFGVALASWLLAQGVTEDISGVSLEATWLSSPGRASEAPPSFMPPDVAVRRVVTTERPASRLAVPRPVLLAVVALAFVAVVIALTRGERAPGTAAEPAPPIGAGPRAEPATPPVAVLPEAPSPALSAPLALPSAAPSAGALPVEQKPRMDSPPRRLRAPRPESTQNAPPRVLKDPFQ
jgi:serine/threonine-protein kinase